MAFSFGEVRLDYVTVFDAAQKSYAWWFPGVAALAALLFGLLAFKKASAVPARVGPAGVLAVLSLVAVAWTSWVFRVSRGQYLRDQAALRDGTAQIVEGTVENFAPDRNYKGSHESFTVRGVSFSYGYETITPGFNRTSAHGGPIRPGQHVRIHYLGHDILRLEISRADLKRMRSERASGPAPPSPKRSVRTSCRPRSAEVQPSAIQLAVAFS